MMQYYDWHVPAALLKLFPGGSLEMRNIYRLLDRDDEYWRHPLNLDGADLQA